MKIGLFILATTLVLFSCQKDKMADPLPIPVAEKTELNVSYGTDASQKMDIYLPAGRITTTTKVIILIHGGGWNQGD